MNEHRDLSPSSDEEENRQKFSSDKLFVTSLTALGIVYGDIGTSPLYALRECFYGKNPFPATSENVLGILSLIFWALVVVISCKYLLFVMKADNRGEGGILALLALLVPLNKDSGKKRLLLFWMGVFGASLLYGDGVITPAISVLSAIEGLRVATPVFDPYVIPLTIIILVLLFLFQKRGTSEIGSLFGPVMALWFFVIAILGVSGIIQAPEVLAALNPWHAVDFFIRYRWAGILVLGSIFLVVTGGETLYTDMGHFGRKPISVAWFSLVFPALLLNYFGQGALILSHPEKSFQPFYHLAPSFLLYPLVFLATSATIIASQAVISGAFSLTRQAMQMDICPRMLIVQTSPEEFGQIYVPAVNWILMIVTILLVIGFGSSSNLASAYGVAVSTTMLITTVLIFRVTWEHWGWRLPRALLVALFFLTVDLSFYIANIMKIEDGGWFPLAAGGGVFLLMTTWRRGREILDIRLGERTEPMSDFLRRISEDSPVRLPRTGVFMSGRTEGVPPMMAHHYEFNKVLHEQVVIVTIVNKPFPRVRAAERLEVEDLGIGFYRVIVHYGFLQSPNVPVALRSCEPFGLKIDPSEATYYLERETLIPTKKKPGMMIWREKLFSFMTRNALRATSFYNIPPERVVEIGIQVEF